MIAVNRKAGEGVLLHRPLAGDQAWSFRYCEKLVAESGAVAARWSRQPRPM